MLAAVSGVLVLVDQRVRVRGRGLLLFALAVGAVAELYGGQSGQYRGCWGRTVSCWMSDGPGQNAYSGVGLHKGSCAENSGLERTARVAVLLRRAGLSRRWPVMLVMRAVLIPTRPGAALRAHTRPCAIRKQINGGFCGAEVYLAWLQRELVDAAGRRRRRRCDWAFEFDQPTTGQITINC